MKRKSYIGALLLFALVFAVSCGKVNLDEVDSKIESLDSRISVLEKQIPELNKSISALGKIIEKKNSDVTVKDCTVSGNTIYIKFSDGTQVEIQSGKSGKDAPFLGIDLYNNVYCWTFTSSDGKTEWLTDDKGNKIPVSGKDGRDGKDGKDGRDSSASVTYVDPQLGVDAQGYWTVSYDGGRTFSRIKDSSGRYVRAAAQSSEGGRTLFKSVADKGDCYEFTLLDGKTFSLGKYRDMGLGFSEEIIVMDNLSAKVNFTVSGSEGLDENEIAVTTVDKGNVTSMVYMNSIKEGLVKVSAHGPWVEGKTKVIVLLASKRHTVTYTLDVAEYEYKGNPDGIPEDPQTDIPDVPDGGIDIPLPGNGGKSDPDPETGKYVYEIIVSGIKDQNGNWMKLFGTGNAAQNVWLELDGTNKGIDVINLEDNKGYVASDLVFTLDNSGTMSEEADVIARDIISWSKLLESRGLDVRFAIVGYNGLINGACNFGTAKDMDNFLGYSTGTSRSMHFSGSDANRLKNASSAYSLSSQEECGAAAIRFANDNFNFRSRTLRTYVNFTDEPNQPHGYSKWSVNFFNNRTNWPASSGVIHTVYSDTDTSFSEKTNYTERPWRMSEYTGGTMLFTNSSFRNVSLDKLPVSESMTHSYTIRFAVEKSIVDAGGTHKLKIVLYSVDRMTYGTLVINNFRFN